MTADGPVDVETAAPPPAVLIVDDNHGKRVAVRSMLEPLNVTVVEASSGRDALRAVLRQKFALILMDVRMPIMDGYETARLIRECDPTTLTPIVFITASMRPDTADTAYTSGAVDFIFTPIHPAVLRVKVSVFIDLFLRTEALERSLDSLTTLHAELLETELRADAVLQNVAEGIVTASATGLIESFNRAAQELFGHTAVDAIGLPLALIIAPSHRRAFTDSGLAAAGSSPWSGERSGTPTETVGRRRDGSCFPMEIDVSHTRIGDREFTIACVHDISERKAHIEALGHQALHDPLTGLPNRTLFVDRVHQSIAAATRANEPRGVLMMDLNGFKQVNDTLGHDCGDTLLRLVGERIGHALRETDTVARLGGDEFGILLDGVIDLAAAATAAGKIERACEPHFEIGGQIVEMAPSIGIALFPEHGRTTADLLRRADAAMYDAKRSGIGHAVHDADHEEQTVRQVALLVDLRRSVTRDELVLHYQPQINLATGRTSGAEALVRWRHPTLGLLPPSRFMPEVERTDLIGPLTRWVLNEALRQQRAWRDANTDLAISVNISARSLRDSSILPETVAELTELWGAAPDRLILELTESALIDAAAPMVLARLHQMGQKVSIDDFGTGYSSLAYLQNLPIDQLKVDRSFVLNLASEPNDAVIVRSTIDLAHNLSLSVVAEGVQDDDARDMLISYGCEDAQGYLFSRPLPADEFLTWLTVSQDRAPADIHS